MGTSSEVLGFDLKGVFQMKNMTSLANYVTRRSIRCALIMSAIWALGSSAHAWTNINIPGDWDGWNQADNSRPWLLNKVSPPGTPAGVDWHTNVVYAASSGGDSTTGTHQYKMVGDQNWANQWSGATVTID